MATNQNAAPPVPCQDLLTEARYTMPRFPMCFACAHSGTMRHGQVVDLRAGRAPGLRVTQRGSESAPGDHSSILLGSSGLATSGLTPQADRVWPIDAAGDLQIP